MCFLARLKMAVLLAKFLWGREGGGGGYGLRQSWGHQGQYPAILMINQ